MIEDKVIICDCGSTSHQVRVHFVSSYIIARSGEREYPDEVYIETNLNPERSIWQRIVIGLKYIFGIQDRDGQFCCVCLDREKVLELREVIDNFIIDSIAH